MRFPLLVKTIQFNASTSSALFAEHLTGDQSCFADSISQTPSNSLGSGSSILIMMINRLTHGRTYMYFYGYSGMDAGE